MTKQILIPLDGSKLAEMVLPHAVAMARANLYGITLLRVVTPPVVVSSTAWVLAPAPAAAEGWEEELEVDGDYLLSVANRLRPLGVDVTGKLVEDEPAEAIVAYANRHPEVEMIAMSSHCREGVGRWVFGSTAEKVLHASPVPVLLTRSCDEDELPKDFDVPVYKSIVVPLDGSDFAAQSLGYVREFASTVHSKISLVTAIPEGPVFTEVVSAPAVPVEPEDEAEEMKAYLEQTSERLRGEGFETEYRLEYGDPAEAILHVADDVHADLVVMATHGRTGLARMWLGSTAIKVVQTCRRPVLMIRVKESGSTLEPATHHEAGAK